MPIEDNPTGVPLFDSVVQQKQAELIQSTERKLLDVRPSSLQTMEQQLRLDSLEVRDRELGIPTLNQRLQGTPERPAIGNFVDEQSQLTGMQYLANIPGSLLAGFGQLDDILLSAPNHVLEALDNFGITSKTNEFMKINYPEARTAFQALDDLGNVIEQGTSYFANSRETEILVDKVSAAYDDNSGAVNVAVSIATTVATNPEAIPEVVAQSLPMMLALTEKGSIFAATFTGMTGQRIDESVATWKETHNGQAPEGEDYNIIAMGAVVATAIETVESRFVLSKHSKVARASADKTARLRGIPGVNTAIRTGQGAAAESFEEGSAEYISQLTGRGDFSFTGLTSDEVVKPSVTNAAIGAGPGGAIKGGTQVLPDTGKVAKKGIQGVSAGVEKLVTVNTEKRLKKAKESGDILGTVEIGLEKDISQQPVEDRKKHVLSLLDKMEDAHDTHDAMEKGAEKTAFKEKLDNLTNQINRVMAASNEASKAEAGETSTVEAEKIIREATASAEEILSAMQTVAADIQKGVAAQPTTVEKILGSTQFEELSDDLQETVTLYNNATKLEQLAKENRTSKGLEDVAQDIEHGNPGDRFIGTKQQQEIVASSISVGNQARANKSVQQLHNLRATILKKLANPAKGKDGKIFGTGAHGQSFVNQLTKEAQSITATMELLNSNIEAAFGKKALSAEKISSPPIQVYGGAATSTPASTDKKTTTPKKSTNKKDVSEQKDVNNISVAAKAQLQMKINFIKNATAKKALQAAFDAAETVEHFTLLRNEANKLIKHEESTVSKQETVQESKVEKSQVEEQEAQSQATPEPEPIVEEEVVTATPTTSVGNGILDVVIPAKSKYTGSKLDKQITRGRTTFSKTYKSAIIDLDNALRAVQQVMRECNV